jgi:hypothetical protein
MVDPLKIFWVLTNSTYLGNCPEKKTKFLPMFVPHALPTEARKKLLNLHTIYLEPWHPLAQHILP